MALMASASSAETGYAIAWNGCTGGSRPAARSRRTCRSESTADHAGCKVLDKSCLQAGGQVCRAKHACVRMGWHSDDQHACLHLNMLTPRC